MSSFSNNSIMWRNIQPYFSADDKYLYYGTNDYTKQENIFLSV